MAGGDGSAVRAARQADQPLASVHWRAENPFLAASVAAGEPGGHTEPSQALRVASADLCSPAARCWSELGVTGNKLSGDPDPPLTLQQPNRLGGLYVRTLLTVHRTRSNSNRYFALQHIEIHAPVDIKTGESHVPGRKVALPA